ncbi:Ser/Thr protein phosphatase [Pseudoalteromonas luteoviolacea CPMOR-2]|uniref:metallophosphoesterase n=1 Tax=Pseudoalteromonas luteoviolacea TaxID=43657 RepID=UPI0007B08ED5|nr:metallophosphoesterase [Pseudoalteromonas luteoviolacea]KZN52141.1 Ser/Thr protein phosphatase [Pseudoalteromonas luteoviolacea CPMOR-2]
MTLKTAQLLVSALFVGSISTVNASQTISFLAFGDGGYHPDYPKAKHVENPKNKAQFIAAEKADWLEDNRPIEEFDHAPIYIYPNTEIATEDTGAAAVGHAMAKLCEIKPCQFGIQLGDNIYPDGADANDGKDDQKRMDDLILGPLKPLFKDNKDLIVYSALGNHDWKTSRKGVKLQTEWMAKQPNFHMDARGYYSYTVGAAGSDVEFFVLDTNMLLSGQHYYEIPLKEDGSEQGLASALASRQAEVEDIEVHESPVSGEDHKQLAWLADGLRNSKAKWKIVYGHHILWSIGGTKYDEGHVLRRLILPELCQYADAYIAGHEHDLELLSDDCSRVMPNNNKPKLPLIISGAASKMRGTHSPFAEQQEKRYAEYDLIWAKSFIWGFAHIELDNRSDSLNVSFYTTPRDKSGALISEASFSFKHRSE